MDPDPEYRYGTESKKLTLTSSGFTLLEINIAKLRKYQLYLASLPQEARN